MIERGVGPCPPTDRSYLDIVCQPDQSHRYSSIIDLSFVANGPLIRRMMDVKSTVLEHTTIGVAV